MQDRFEDYFTEGVSLTVKKYKKPYCRIISEDDEVRVLVCLSKTQAQALIDSL